MKGICKKAKMGRERVYTLVGMMQRRGGAENARKMRKEGSRK